MITLEAANLAITLVKGIIKLTRSVDLVLAEKAAVEAPIALPAPNLALGPSFNQMRKGLLGLLDRPLDAAGDPLGGDRKPIRELLAGSPEAADMEPWVKKYLPELALGTLVDLNKEFVTVLRETRPDWAADPDILLAAFHVGAGADFRNKGYPWRLALTVVDVLAELGAENAPKFVRDPGLQSLVGEVLKRFADADLQKADSTGELVRGVLAATLNGVVDARGTLGLKQEWLTGLLDALSAAREKAASPDNFILGLVQGQGYPLLVGATLDLAAGKLADGQAPAFRKTAATFLGQVAELVRSQPSFEGFFKEHWSGLLRAGLDSVAQHGPALLAGNEPLLGQVLSAVVASLARFPELRRLDNRISGVLGWNFLAQFNFTLDFRQRRINLADMDENQFKQTEIEQTPEPAGCKIFGQYDNRYILAEYHKSLLLIDQQAAHERIIYERNAAMLNKTPAVSQQELFPQTMEFNHSDYVILKEISDDIRKMGFDLREFC